MTWDKSSIASLIRIRPFLIVLRLVCVSLMANGGHIAGSEIGYRYLGNRSYEVVYRIYTDQTGGCPGTISPLEAKSIQCSVYRTAYLQLQTPSGEAVNSVCSGSNSGVSFTRWTYTGTIQLPFDCDDWKLSASECCRGATINSIVSPDQSAIYAEAWLNTTSYTLSSLEFLGMPELIVWSGQHNQKIIRAGQSGLDSVVITTIAPRISSASEVSYVTGYSSDRPLNLGAPVQIERISGAFNMTPNQQETGVIAFKATGYKNGNAVTSVSREHRIVSLLPTNHVPQLSGFE